jgi:hypothetical protein
VVRVAIAICRTGKIDVSEQMQDRAVSVFTRPERDDTDPASA